jgi:uncharacterized ferritin-like protein (DUF455 family)
MVPQDRQPGIPPVDLFARAVWCLAQTDAGAKQQETQAAAAAWRSGELALDRTVQPAVPDEAGRPPRPRLVAPGRLASRGTGSRAGRAALVHALAHIEFNAINLAWDAVARFRDMPREFYDDWIRVADEEAKHFGLLCARLADLGHVYGDFDAHEGLWEMARKTAGDVLVRMALVPRVLEARGLDVAPDMIARLKRAGDQETAAILEIILREEVGHVDIGSRWYTYVCGQRGLDPVQTCEDLWRQYAGGALKMPLNLEARRQAGFSDEELDLVSRLAGRTPG